MRSVDHSIHPHATGTAAKTVAQHDQPQDLVFYAGWFCPFVQRSWISLEEKGIPYQYIEINPYKKEKHFLDINPKGLVPALEFKGKALYESLVICEFLEDAYPKHKPNLLPDDPYDRAIVRLQVDHISKTVLPAFYRTLQAQEKDKQELGLQELYSGLRQLAQKVKGPYFLGEQFSLVDIAIAPWAVRDFLLADHRGYKREDVGSGWKEWAENLESRESVLKSSSDKEHYVEVYGRYLRDETQSEVAKATRGGKPLP